MLLCARIAGGAAQTTDGTKLGTLQLRGSKARRAGMGWAGWPSEGLRQVMASHGSKRWQARRDWATERPIINQTSCPPLLITEASQILPQTSRSTPKQTMAGRQAVWSRQAMASMQCRKARHRIETERMEQGGRAKGGAKTGDGEEVASAHVPDSASRFGQFFLFPSPRLPSPPACCSTLDSSSAIPPPSVSPSWL
ncbi:hypothetical protein J3F83DRAFT_589994 [Trichoderma novae-zelandiae]